MNFDWSTLGKEQMQIYRELCPDNEYRVFKMDFELPGVSKGLTEQCPVVLMASSGDANGRVFFMANLHRPDPRDPKGKAIDQMPFGFVFDNESPMLSGALIQHGNWDGRTTYPATSAWCDVVAGVFDKYVDLDVVPLLSAGSIYDLDNASQHGAFSTLVDGLSAKASELVKKQASAGTSPAPTTITFGDDEPQEIKSSKTRNDSTT